MAKKIEIYENTLLKLLVRRGIDMDRKNVVLSEGELGYTTDLKKLYIGDGQTPGGVLVGGNSILPSTNNILSLSDVTEGDVVFSPSDGKLYRFLGGVNDSLARWEVIGGTTQSGDGTIDISGDNKITVGVISAGNIDPSALLGDGLTVDSVTGKITLSPDIPIDVINTSTPGGFLELPGNLKINNIEYRWPAGGLESNMYLSTDVSGNLTWKQLESTTTVVATGSGGQIPVGTIVPFVSSANVPTGWLLCNGQSILKASYPDLYNTIGDTYGSDATTFKIPDFINKSLYGVQTSPEASTLYNLDTSVTSTLSAAGTLFLIKAIADTVATPTLTISSPLSCTVDGVDKTGLPISPYEGNIVIAPTPVSTLAGSTGYRNKVINGNFDFWQRATSTINSPISAITRSRTADRWGCYATGISNATFSVTRQACTDTEQQVFNANFYQRLTYRNGVGSNKIFALEEFIGPDTDINIIADSSGSMDATLTVLQAAVDTGAIKARLLPYYSNNETLYNQRVKFVPVGGERTFGTSMLNRAGSGGSRLINIVFQDECDGGNAYNSTNNANYTTDVTDFRTTLGTYTLGDFIGLVFQVNYSNLNFKNFLGGVKAGTSPFTALNLSDKPEVKFVYDVTKAGTQQYYTDLIVNALLNLDINTVYDGPPTYEVLDRNDNGVLALQQIENAAEILGKNVTLSFWARASQPTKIFSESQIFTTTGTSMWTPTIHKVFNLSTTWQKFTHTYTMPTFAQVSAVGYNPNSITYPVPEVPAYTPLGSTGSLPPLSSWLYQVDIKTHWTKGLAIQSGNAWSGSTSYRPGSAVNYPGEAMTLSELIAINTSVLSGAEGWYDIAQVQLEEGSEATDFEFRPTGIELGLCQRYYYKTYDTEVLPNTVTDDGSIWSHEPVAPVAGGIHCAQGSFAVPMAKKPTVRFYNPRNSSAATGTYGSVYVEGATGSNGTVYSVALGAKRISTISVNFADPSPPTSNLYITGYHFTADAEI
jgi:microcystin-dependent protein